MISDQYLIFVCPINKREIIWFQVTDTMNYYYNTVKWNKYCIINITVHDMVGGYWYLNVRKAQF